MTHPLTEEICDQLHGDEPGYSNPYDEDDMQAAADWQLEQVMKWLGRNILDYDWKPLDKLEGDLKKAMRPTPQEDN